MSRDIEVALIDRDEQQPRKHFDETQIAELAQSIAASGLIQPIMVRPAGGRYVIVHGERRFRACVSLGWQQIPATVAEIDDETVMWWALIENIQRADLSPIEEAEAYQRALSSGITQAALGEKVGKSQSHIASKLRLLGLPPYIREGIAKGRITEGHAKQLLRLKGNSEALMTLYGVACDFSVAETKTIVDRAFAIIDLMAAIQAQNWGQADAILVTLPDAPQNNPLGREGLLRYAEAVTERFYTLLPEYRPKAGSWDGYEPTESNQLWLETFGAHYIIEQQRLPDDLTARWALQLRMASAIEPGGFPFVCNLLLGVPHE